MQTIRAGLALCGLLVALTAQAQSEVVQRRYPLGGDDALVVRVPAEWQQRIAKPSTKGPRAVSFGPKNGAAFEVLVTPARARDANRSFEQLKPSVLALAEAAGKQAREESLVLVELIGPQARGYYFKATDRAPKRGEYKYLTQGVIAVGELRVGFTILTNEGQEEVVNAAFSLLRNARFTGAAEPDAAPAVAGKPPRPEAGQLQALLAAGDFAQLDRELAAYQEAYRAGVINDDAAAQAFRVLVTADADLRAAYEKWVSAMPRSYVARVARGYYLARLGYQARGTAYAAKTTATQFDEMRALFKLAIADLEASMALDPKPVLGYGTLISIAQAAGNREQAARYLERAVAIDRRVYTARASYLASLRPNWGGSIEQMQAALDSWKTSLEPAQFDRLALMVHDAKWQAALAPAAQMVNAKQYKEAIAMYDGALKQQPVARAYAMRGHSYAQLGDHAKAIADFDRALELDPDGSCCSGTRSSRARSHLVSGEVQKGISDLVAAAEAEDTWASRELAMIYAYGKYGFKRDFVVARRWCEMSAKQGDGMAMYCLGGIYHGGLGVPKDLRLAVRWFEDAASRGIADAQADLAFMLWHGQGIAQDRDLAIKWWRAAAKAGDKRAQQQLDANVTGWERFTKVTIPDWLESK